jgi:hypothetical protein
MFDVWWPRLTQRIEAITVAPQPGLKEPSEKEHLGEILSLTRAILRELQAPRHLQVFAPNREMEAFARALMKPQGLGQASGWVAALADELTPKSE